MPNGRYKDKDGTILPDEYVQTLLAKSSVISRTGHKRTLPKGPQLQTPGHTLNTQGITNTLGGQQVQKVGQQMKRDYQQVRQVGGQQVQQLGGQRVQQVGGQRVQQVGGQRVQQVGGQRVQQVGGRQGQQVGGQQVQQVRGQQVQQVGGQQVPQVGGQQVQPVGGQQLQQVGGQRVRQVGGQQVPLVGGQLVQPVGGQQVQQVGGQHVQQVGGQQVQQGGDQQVPQGPAKKIQLILMPNGRYKDKDGTILPDEYVQTLLAKSNVISRTGGRRSAKRPRLHTPGQQGAVNVVAGQAPNDGNSNSQSVLHTRNEAQPAPNQTGGTADNSTAAVTHRNGNTSILIFKKMCVYLSIFPRVTLVSLSVCPPTMQLEPLDL